MGYLKEKYTEQLLRKFTEHKLSRAQKGQHICHLYKLEVEFGNVTPVISLCVFCNLKTWHPELILQTPLFWTDPLQALMPQVTYLQFLVTFSFLFFPGILLSFSKCLFQQIKITTVAHSRHVEGIYPQKINNNDKKKGWQTVADIFKTLCSSKEKSRPQEDKTSMITSYIESSVLKLGKFRWDIKIKFNNSKIQIKGEAGEGGWGIYLEEYKGGSEEQTGLRMNTNLKKTCNT